MGNNLVIVESPGKVATIQKYLGNEYSVKASKGHIRDLQDKRLSVDVEHGFKPEYVIPSEKKKTVADLRKLAAEADTVWLASDPDREGEAIAWHLFDTLGLDKEKTHRIVFHEVTKRAIQEAVAAPRDIDMDLVNAQQARRVLDRLVGFELSPVLWKKIQRGLSAGRVQSVTLRLVVDREREIQAFTPEKFWKVEAIFKFGSITVKGVLDTKFSRQEDAEAFLRECIGASYEVSGVEEKEGSRYPAAPFITSTLQQEAGRRLHFPVNMTMRVAQSLYERGLITYMRTDSTNLAAEALSSIKSFVVEQFGQDYLKVRNYKTRSKGAQEAHEAIRPTFVGNVSIEGSAQEKKLYELIWKRTVASQMADAKVLGTSVKVTIHKAGQENAPVLAGDSKYIIQASRILFDGFLKLNTDGGDDTTAREGAEEVVLPDIKVGDNLSCVRADAECKFTQAPSRYSEMTLIKKMEEIGIGRPSTYGPTVSTLTTGRGYLVKGDKEGKTVEVTDFSLKGDRITETKRKETVGAEKGKLLPQDIGIIVTDYLVDHFPGLMSYDFTANVEKDLDEIAEGKLDWGKVISDFYSPFHTKVGEVSHDGQYSHVERELGTDPDSGLKLIAKFGQYGPYIQKGEGEARVFASLGTGQTIESITLEDALKLFALPRTVGQYEGTDIIATRGKFGPYIRHGSDNVSLPKNADPLNISLDECIDLIVRSKARIQALSSPVKEWKESDIAVINGRFGPYIKHAGSNYRIPKETDPALLTEEDCKKIIGNGAPSGRKFRRFTKKKQ